jgi:hypothetical protein
MIAKPVPKREMNRKVLIVNILKMPTFPFFSRFEKMDFRMGKEGEE